jgi:dephospho-CoA kinase
MFIVEAVDATKKRTPVYNSDKVVMLDDIAIYTDTEEVPLRDVFAKIYEKENGVLQFDIKAATPEELVAYFETVMPDYDRERVYLTHIKKIYSWYNILVSNGVVDFVAPEEEASETAE